MPDPETPPENPGQEPGAGEPRETPQLPQEQIETPPETPPETSPQQFSEEEILHKTQSWTGRRLAEMKDEIIGAVREMMPANAGPATPAPDPTVDADAWFEHKLSEKMKQEQKYNSDLYKTGMGLIESDPLIQTDETLKDEILAEVQSGRVPINRQLDPANAAQVALALAKANVLTRRMTQPRNPLDGNAPSSVPKGGVTPPETPPKPAVKVPEMSGYAKKMAKMWGYTDEQIAQVLNESK